LTIFLQRFARRTCLYAATLLAASCFCGQDAATSEEASPLPLVEQHVECVSVAHLPNGGDAVFFWDIVQGQWAYLDHRWLSDQMDVRWDRDSWVLSWPDESEGCHRRVRTPLWVESWESDSPLAEQAARPWFCRMTAVGLKQPPQR